MLLLGHAMQQRVNNRLVGICSCMLIFEAIFLTSYIEKKYFLLQKKKKMKGGVNCWNTTKIITYLLMKIAFYELS